MDQLTQMGVNMNPMMMASAASGLAAAAAAGITDPDKVQEMLAQQMQAANPQLTRQARTLYVGNLPVGADKLSEKLLLEFFSATISQFGLQMPNPVLSVWLSSEGMYCFVELRIVQDTTACITLCQGLSLGGRPLRIGRPADYKPPPPALENYVVGYTPGMYKPPSATGTPGGCLGVSSAALSAAMMALKPSAVILPSRCLLLLNMVTLKDLDDDEEFADIVLDIREEGEKYGTVEQVVIPRPIRVKAGETEDDPDSSQVQGIGVDRGPRTGAALGRIFVLYKDTDMCSKARVALEARVFNSNRVEASYFPEDKFLKNEYL